jgi:signal transduction histidine kinase
MGVTRRPHAADPDVAAIRRVGLRLALLAVGLLLALLLALATIVYLTARSEILHSLHEMLRIRAVSGMSNFAEMAQPDSGEPPSYEAESDQESTGVFIAYADRSLRLLGGDARVFGMDLPDRAAAAATVQDGTSRYSTRVGPSGARYLIFSDPVLDRGKVIGLVQTGASLRQYDETISDLTRVLLTAGSFGLLALGAIAAVLVRRSLSPIRQALRRQRDFVADAAHELRTPVTILRTAAELGLESGNSIEQQAALEQALAESTHLARLVDDLSLLARADSGVLSLERNPVDLADLAREAVSGVELLAEDREVRLILEAHGTPRVAGDRGRLRQLLLILLDNALKHTPDGGTVTVRLAGGHGNAEIQVQDSGAGIDPRDLPRLFDRFYRARREHQGEGGGLGLAIGRWIAEAHGGRITAANAQPHGALFTVRLPLL